jgi:hypothetical protein
MGKHGKEGEGMPGNGKEEELMNVGILALNGKWK